MADHSCECKLLVAPKRHYFYLDPAISSIFIRDHYNNIIPRLRLDYKRNKMSKLTTVLTGTPGVGRSLFAVYLLWYICIILTSSKRSTLSVLLEKLGNWKALHGLFAVMRKVVGFKSMQRIMIVNQIYLFTTVHSITPVQLCMSCNSASIS